MLEEWIRFYNTADCKPDCCVVRKAPLQLSILTRLCKLWDSLLRPLWEFIPRGMTGTGKHQDQHKT